MDATQQIEDTFFEKGDDRDEENELRERKKERKPLATLKVFKNSYIPEMEVPLYLGENVLGRDPASCCFPLEARSVSSRHAIISISVFPAKNKGPTVTEALLWDLGSLNGTRKGHFKLTPHVRYALTEGDSLILADLPCQYIGMKSLEKKVKMDTAERGIRRAKDPAPKGSGSEKMARGDAEVEKKVLLPPVPLFSNEEKRCLQSPETTPKQPERTLVPESDSDSEGEKRGQRERIPFLASDSASSDLSSPTCSTFLTPASKVIPESEDESAITPSSSLAGRLKKAEDHSIASSDSPKPVPLAFNIDSDTDVEEDERDESKREQDVEMQATPVNPATGNVESNTDLASKSGPRVDESVRTKTAPPSGSEVALEKKSGPVLCPLGYPAHAELDSDTDVEDSSDLTNAETSSSELAKPDVITPNENKNKEEFHIESDTDEEDEDALMTAAVSRSKLDTSDSKASAKHGTEFHVDSRTDAAEPEKSTEVVEPLSESDTDDDDPFKPKQVKPTETLKAPKAKVLKPHSDSDTDIEDNAVRADVDEEEEGLEEREEKGAERAGTWRCSTPRESDVPEENMETQAFLSPSQTFKRPAPISAHPSSVSLGHISPDCDDYVVAETQSFVSDATLDKSLEARRPLPSDQDFFQLGLSDSNLQQETESQRLGGAERDWDLQPTQLYAMGNHEDKGGRSSARDKGLDLEATQAYTPEVDQEEQEHEEKLLDDQVHSSLSAAETQVFRVQEAEKNDIVFEGPSGERGGRKGGAAAAEEEEEEAAALVDSHLSTAETVIIVRSPREEEQTQPFTHLTTLPFEEVVFSTEARSSATFNNRTGSDAKVYVGIAETLPIEVEGVDEEHTEPIDSDPTGYDAVAEMFPLSEGEEIEEHPSSEPSPHVRPPGVERQQEDQTQSIEADAGGLSALSVIQPLHGDEEESVEHLETKRGTHGKPRRARLIEKEKESTSEAKSQRRPRRGKWEEVEQTQPIVLDALDQTDVAVTQPVCDNDEGQEEEEQNENSSSGRPRRGRQVQKPIVPVADLQVSAAKTQPINENDSRQEREPTTESISSRRSRRSRMIDKEQKQTIDPPTEAPQTVAENLPRDESVEQSTTQPGRGLRGRGGRGRGASTRGKGKTPIGREGRKKRGRAKSDEERVGDEESEGKESGRKSMRQKAIKKKEERGEQEQQPTESRQETTEVREHLDRQEGKEKHQEREEVEKSEIETKRMDQEKKEQLQAEDEERKRMEREKERKDIEKREQADKDRLEQERMEKEKKEQLEKERKEREESERLKKEHKEQLQKERRELERDRLEQERKKREEMESLEREKQEREERDRQEKNRLERERREQEEKKRLEREMGEKESRELEKKEQLERRQERNMEEQEAVEKKRRGRRGKRRASVAKRGKKTDKEEKNEAEERSERSGNAESTIQEGGETGGEKEKDEGEERGSEQTEKENEGKPKRGRRPTRKSAVPMEDGPAKRTRSRSNSSNSACSEQYTPVQEGSGRGRGRKRKVAEEVGDSSRTTVGRRRTATVPSSNLEETKQGGRGRKSLKMEEAVKEGPDAVTVGRGRAKRGVAKHSGSGDVKVEAIDDHQMREESESMSTSDDGVLSQASSRGRKRGSDTSSSPTSTPKTPRRSIASHSPKILFTGMTDEYWEEVLVRLGGSLANGVGDMTHLVTDKVRRTVKFLCAVARGVPIVTTQWLAKSGKAGIFLSPSMYLVKDVEQEKKFNFSLEESLRTASHQPLLQGYEIHVTPSVKPEPSHMKDIIICCGARYLPRMPAAHKPQTVVVSCEEDRALCERVLSLSLPVVTAEFLLTGILQQKVDLNAHVLLSSLDTASKPIAQGHKK